MEGDKLAIFVNSFLDKLRSQKTIEEKQIKRFKKGLAVFIELRKLVRKAHNDMSQKVSEGHTRLIDKAKEIVVEARQTFMNELSNTMANAGNEVSKEERALEEVKEQLGTDTEKLHGAEKELAGIEDAQNEMGHQIRHEATSWGEIEKYPPLFKMAELIEEITGRPSPGSLIKEWMKINKGIEQNTKELELATDVFADLKLCLKEVGTYHSDLGKELSQEKETKEGVLFEWAEEIEGLEARRQEHVERIADKRFWWERKYSEIFQKEKTGFADFEEDPSDIHSLDFLRTMLLRIEQAIRNIPTQQAFAERYESLSQDWIDRIKEQNEKDKRDLRLTYISNANVIGSTCSKTGQFAFREEYGVFDVVIVDEVSKATPPELLLPVLLGKKVILVGDDKQLPPMIGHETLRALADETGCVEEELSHVKRSIFSDLWMSAPDEIRTMLTLQYRMHPTIMNVINQFYDYQLECGIKNPNVERAHGCGGPRIPENAHAIWIDVPRQEEFREKKVGTSFKNRAELSAIEAVVKDLNDRWGAKVKEGKMPKEVGIVTYYAAQTRLLEDTFLDNNDQYPNLVFRIGTVNRFQEMERPIVIVSMVRNNEQGLIGFAKDPELINVGLSRAQELLIMVGCASLFCSETRSTSAMKIYRNVEAVLRREGELTNVRKFINN